MPTTAAAMRASSSSGRDESTVTAGPGVKTNKGIRDGARGGAGLGGIVPNVMGAGDGDTVGPGVGANEHGGRI